MLRKIFLSSLIVILLAIFFVGYQHNQDYFKRYPKVRMALVERKNLVEDVEVRGEIRARDLYNLRSEVSGRIEKILVEEGYRVKKDEILIQINKAEKELQIQQTRIELLGAKRQLEEAKAGGLLKDVEIAAQKLESYRTKLRIYEEQLKNMVIRSPIAGTIICLYVEQGDTVSAGRPLLTLANLEDLVVESLVDVLDIYKVTPGQKAIITSDALPEEEFAGLVSSISPTAQVKDGMRLVKLTINIDKGKEILIPGTPVEVCIQTREKELALVIPQEAVFEEREEEKENPVFFLTDYLPQEEIKRYVFTIEEPEEILEEEERERLIRDNIYVARKKEVEVGISNINEVEIKSGIKQFDQVIVYSDRPLEDYQRVMVIRRGKENRRPFRPGK